MVLSIQSVDSHSIHREHEGTEVACYYDKLAIGADCSSGIAKAVVAAAPHDNLKDFESKESRCSLILAFGDTALKKTGKIPFFAMNASSVSAEEEEAAAAAVAASSDTQQVD